MAEITNFQIRQGTAPLLRLSLIAPKDITGWTSSFVLKEHATYANTVLIKAGSTANTQEVPLAATLGVFDVKLTKADTLTLTLGKKYHWYFERTDNGSEDVLASGEVEIIPK